MSKYVESIETTGTDTLRLTPSDLLVNTCPNWQLQLLRMLKVSFPGCKAEVQRGWIVLERGSYAEDSWYTLNTDTLNAMLSKLADEGMKVHGSLKSPTEPLVYIVGCERELLPEDVELARKAPGTQHVTVLGGNYGNKALAIYTMESHGPCTISMDLAYLKLKATN